MSLIALKQSKFNLKSKKNFTKHISLVTDDCLYDLDLFNKAKNWFDLLFLNNGKFMNYKLDVLTQLKFCLFSQKSVLIRDGKLGNH